MMYLHLVVRPKAAFNPRSYYGIHVAWPPHPVNPAPDQLPLTVVLCKRQNEISLGKFDKYYEGCILFVFFSVFLQQKTTRFT